MWALHLLQLRAQPQLPEQQEREAQERVATQVGARQVAQGQAVTQVEIQQAAQEQAEIQAVRPGHREQPQPRREQQLLALRKECRALLLSPLQQSLSYGRSVPWIAEVSPGSLGARVRCS